MAASTASLDSAALASLIGALLDLSTTSGIPTATKDEAAVAARRLRGNLVAILSARFDEGTASLLRVNKRIADLNKGLAQDKVTLDSYAKLVQKASKLVSGLDKLMAQAVKFL